MLNISIPLKQILNLYNHTISNVKILQYHQELDENVETDKKLVLEDLIFLTTLVPQSNISKNIIEDLQRATTLTQLVDNSYETNDVIQKLNTAMSLIKEMQ